jgi:hypothetical protein
LAGNNSIATTTNPDETGYLNAIIFCNDGSSYKNFSLLLKYIGGENIEITNRKNVILEVNPFGLLLMRQ